MNKLVAGLCIIAILLSAACGIRYYQIGDVQSQNSNLLNQINQLETKNSALESQLDELAQQNLVLENQTSELENRLDEISKTIKVKITGITPKPEIVAPMLLRCDVTVTVRNLGTESVENLNLSVKHISADQPFRTVPTGAINTGETKNITTYVEWGWLEGDTIVATLTLYDRILDETEFNAL
jgi:hypothetical protein